MASVPNRGPALFAVNTAGVLLAGVSCSLRCFVRVRTLKSFWLDDCPMVLSALTFTAYAALSNIMRMPYLKYMGSVDFLWETVPTAVWSTVEAGLAITAGCLATLQPLLKMARCRLGTSGSTGPRGGAGSVVAVRRDVMRRTERALRHLSSAPIWREA